MRELDCGLSAILHGSLRSVAAPVMLRIGATFPLAPAAKTRMLSAPASLTTISPAASEHSRAFQGFPALVLLGPTAAS